MSLKAFVHAIINQDHLTASQELHQVLVQKAQAKLSPETIEEAIWTKYDDAVAKARKICDRMSDNAAKNMNIHAASRDFYALFVGGSSSYVRLADALEEQGFQLDAEKYETNLRFWKKLGVSKQDFQTFIDAA